MILAPVAPAKPLYIVHKGGKPLVWPLNHSDGHAIVSFSKFKTAATIATLTESHYVTHKEWPSGGIAFSFKDQVTPTILGIQEVELSDVAILCSTWNLQLLIIEDLTKNKYTGEIRTFDVDPESRVNHLNSLWYPGV